MVWTPPDGIDVPTKLLARHQWRDCDVALLTAAAARLGLPTGSAPTRDCHREGD
jgi:predicted nuclease with RNAse H fold